MGERLVVASEGMAAKCRASKMMDQTRLMAMRRQMKSARAHARRIKGKFNYRRNVARQCNVIRCYSSVRPTTISVSIFTTFPPVPATVINGYTKHRNSFARIYSRHPAFEAQQCLLDSCDTILDATLFALANCLNLYTS